MIVQTVQITCMTGNAESVQRALADVVDDAREHEPDTLDYMVLRCDEGEMVLFTTVECFSDEAAMKLHNESKRQLNELAESMGMNFSPEDLDFFHEELDATMAAYDAVDALPDYLPAVKYPRVTGYHPDASENEHNAWAWKVDVEGAADGPLKGKTVALKDNVCLAGVPMRNGSNLLVPRSRARRFANTSACQAGATRRNPVRCIIRSRKGIRQAGRPREARRLSGRARSTWPSAGTKGVPFGYLPPIRAFTV